MARLNCPESRAEQINHAALPLGWRVTWRLKGRYLYANVRHLPPKPWDEFRQTDPNVVAFNWGKVMSEPPHKRMRSFLEQFYKDVRITSCGKDKHGVKATFCVMDIWETLKRPTNVNTLVGYKGVVIDVEAHYYAPYIPLTKS